MPRIADVVRDIGADRVRAALPGSGRLLRKRLDECADGRRLRLGGR